MNLHENGTLHEHEEITPRWEPRTIDYIVGFMDQLNDKVTVTNARLNELINSSPAEAARRVELSVAGLSEDIQTIKLDISHLNFKLEALLTVLRMVRSEPVQAQPKSKRGRPKGSKNKPKALSKSKTGRR